MAFRFADVIDYLLPFRGKADPDDPLNFYDLPDDTLSQELQILEDVDGGNRQLAGRRAALTYLNMSRDGQIAGMLALLAGPIISSTWGVESDSEEISAFVEEQLGIGQGDRTQNAGKVLPVCHGQLRRRHNLAATTSGIYSRIGPLSPCAPPKPPQRHRNQPQQRHHRGDAEEAVEQTQAGVVDLGGVGCKAGGGIRR